MFQGKARAAVRGRKRAVTTVVISARCYRDICWKLVKKTSSASSYLQLHNNPEKGGVGRWMQVEGVLFPLLE